MKTRIVTLIENSQGEHLALKTEHGISFYIETNQQKILFDTGQSGAFIENAEKLGINLKDLNVVALSHGHYDHSGGFKSLTEYTNSFNLILGKGFFNKKFATDGLSYEFLGNDFDENYMKRKKIHYEFLEEPIRQIATGVYALTDFSRVHPDEVINPRFVLETEKGFVPDPFTDEICLAVDTEKGFVVLVGCSHPGIKNMLDTARKLLPKPIYSVIGGTHLVEASPNCLADSLQYFKNAGFGAVGVSHCTGAKATAELEKTIKEFFKNTTGHSLIL